MLTKLGAEPSVLAKWDLVLSAQSGRTRSPTSTLYGLCEEGDGVLDSSIFEYDALNADDPNTNAVDFGVTAAGILEALKPFGASDLQVSSGESGEDIAGSGSDFEDVDGASLEGDDTLESPEVKCWPSVGISFPTSPLGNVVATLLCDGECGDHPTPSTVRDTDSDSSKSDDWLVDERSVGRRGKHRR